MKRLFAIIILFGTLYLNNGCSKHGVRFEVLNQTDENFDSIVISNGFSNIKVERLKKDSIYNLFLDFKQEDKIQTKGDGSYSIQTYTDSEVKSFGFGYFNNGISLANNYHLFIKNDTVLVREYMN